MTDSPSNPVRAMSPQDAPDKGSAQQAEGADQAATDSSGIVDGAMSEEATVRQSLAEERMNRTMSLPECMCLRVPRVVSYSEVGDPSGYPVCISYCICCWCKKCMFCFSILFFSLVPFLKMNI